jgi:prepilin-type N-terminal cleavage/methylation domain-containing protein
MNRRAFTLVELLTVVAIVGVLAAILIPAIGQARQTARTSREIAAAHFLIQSYLVVPQDRRGQLLPGSKNEPAFDEQGAPLGFFSNRWPARLAPYLGGRLKETLFVNDQAAYYDTAAATAAAPGQASYLYSLTPSFALNITHVGGIYLDSGALDTRNDPSPVARLETCDNPSRQLVFVSAANRAIAADAGYFEARSPAQASWPQNLDTTAADSTHGWVSFRNRGKAVTSWLDGHVTTETYDALRDMRAWAQAARLADNASWRP